MNCLGIKISDIDYYVSVGRFLWAFYRSFLLAFS